MTAAAEKVSTAQHKMTEAADKLAQSPPELVKVNTDQEQAVEALQQALAILSPPQQQQNDPKGQKPSAQQGQEKQDGGGKPPPQQDDANADPSQLLQGIRDREAQRREQQGKSQHGAYEPVERDW